MATNLPTLKQLRHLAALAEHGHFGRAAKAAHVTQSTLSASLKELEQTLGAALVDRTQRRVVFTPLGREVVELARRLLDEAEALAELARARGKPLTGPLRFGVIPTISPFFLPRVLPGLRRAYPALQLLLVEDQTARLVEQLNDGKLDVLLLALPYDIPSAETALVARDPFSLVCPKDHPLAKSAPVPPASLQHETLLLLRDGHCLRGHALDACALADRRESAGVEATSLHTLVQMVDNGLGVTLLPQIAIDAGILRGTQLVARALDGARASRDLGLVWRRGTARRAEFELLASELKRLAEKAK
ncbi:MAG: hydrogen peroxide-inducible genes activator [Alphaproteobacteria bacterium]|nr:hydrogen peroxide-inducible genes activator [Alphaproteobacteria bacterium]